jgi:cytidylate kinase
MKRVVCISRTLGAGGEDIARQVAQKLGFRYIDDEIVSRAAEKAGVTEAEIASAEHSPSLVTRILEAMSAAPTVSEAGYIVPHPRPVGGYSHVIEHVIRETAEAGDVVIVAHGASHALTDRPDVLRVFVTASPSVRQDRLTREEQMEASAARKAVETSDRERARYLERFYNVHQEVPTNYDLTLNTDTIGIDSVVNLITSAAGT